MFLGQRAAASGFTLLEVLLTVFILAFGALGLAGLQMVVQTTQMESYQRAHAVLLLQDMAARMQANRPIAGSYVFALNSPLGVGDTQPASCAGLVGVALDRCEWSNALKGAAETKGGGNVGAMIGARGCVEQIQAPNPAAGVCTPGSYRISVAWQGIETTVAPPLLCAKDLYGNDALRRLISTTLTVGLPGCI